MIKQALKQILRVQKEKLRYLKYKDTLPNNPNNSDLYIVEFPKSGITWFSTIIANTCFLEEKINKVATHFNLEQYIGDVHQNKIISQNNTIFPYHRIIKSHDSYNPYYRHVIYLVRNPFSVMTSYYHFTTNNNTFDGTFDEFIRNKKFGIESWVKHVKSWLQPQKVLKLHYLKYEDLIDNPHDTIANLYKNLGWSIEKSRISKSIEMSTFDNMKILNDHYKNFCPFRKYDFVRKGQKKTEISKEAEDYIYQHTVEILKELYPDMVRK
jgi:hypothetical protein